jgi:hypothetical protein
MSREAPLASVSFSTVYVRLPDMVADVVGFEMQASHHCMECGERVGGATMLDHARWHVDLPPKPKPPKNGQPAKPGGSS